jgi:hypothetical protein
MAKIPNLQQIRDTIRGNIMSENIGKQSNGNTQQLHNATAIVPESTMWRLVTWLHEVHLPKVAHHRGINSEEYKNYVAIRDAVIWSLHISQQYEKVLMQRGRDRQLLGYYIEQNAKLEAELQKYTTIEQLISNDAIDMYRQSIVSKALDIITQTKKTT